MKRSTHQHQSGASGAGHLREEAAALEAVARHDLSSDDYSTSAHAIVPLQERRPLWHFIGLWTTFMVGFIYILEGVEIYSAGYGLAACLGLSVLGCAVYFLYAIFAAYLGSRTGQTHSLLTRSIFGVVGSYVVAVLLILPPLASTGFQANLMVEIWHGLYGWHGVELLTIVFSSLMVFNNLFGFGGISVFARYVVTPAMILWAIYMVAKGLIDGTHLGMHPKNAAGYTFWQILGIAIGAGVWGNEPDIWRYAKPKLSWAAAGFAFALFVAGSLFVVAGWMMAALSGSTDFSTIVNFTTHYSLFGLLPLAFILGTIAQIALNDGNYYQATTAFQNVFGGWSRWKRLYSCLIAAAIAGFAGWYVNYGSENGFALITGLASITLPCATVIMVVDHFVLPPVLRISRPLLKVPAWNETGLANVPAIAALVLAVAFGCVATGTLPQDGSRYWGPATPVTWLLAGSLYVAFAALAKALASDTTALRRILGFSKLLADTPLASREVHDLGASAGLGAPVPSRPATAADAVEVASPQVAEVV